MTIQKSPPRTPQRPGPNPQNPQYMKILAFFLHSLHHDGQAHARVDGTVEMEGPGRGEGAKGGLTRATDLQILDLRCARLVLRFGRPIFPCSVRNGVRSEDVIIDERNALALLDGDRVLDKMRAAHMDGIGACAGAGAATGDQQHGDNTA